MIPAPTPVVIAELVALDFPNVGTEVDDSGALPAIRVAKTGDFEAPSSWEATPLFQVECWAASEGEAEDLAWRIKNDWPDFVGHPVTISDFPAVRVHARWVEVDPYPLPDPDGTDYARFVLSVGIRYSGDM